MFPIELESIKLFLDIPLFTLFVYLFNQINEGQYGTIDNRLISFFKPLSLLRIIRYSFLIIILSVLVYYSNSNNLSFSKNKSFLMNEYYASLIKFWYLYIILFIIISIIIFFLNKSRIKKDIKPDFRSKKYNYLLKFSSVFVFKNSLIVVFFFLSYYIIYLIDSHFFINKIYPSISFEHNRDLLFSIDASYRRGIYQSSLILILIFIFLINVFLKRNFSGMSDKKYISFIAIIVCCTGMYSGLYSIINSYFNLYFNTFPNWIEKDKLLGNYSLKISGLIILMSLLLFIFRFVYGGRISLFLKYAFLPSKPDNREVYQLERKEYNINDIYSKQYISQVGFYILNIFISEILIIKVEELNFLFILFTILPIFVDDYLVLHYYISNGSRINIWHYIKKIFFNFILFISAMIFLIINGWWVLLLLYIIFSLILYFLNPLKK